jgi:hypothetical protein
MARTSSGLTPGILGMWPKKYQNFTRLGARGKKVPTLVLRLRGSTVWIKRASGVVLVLAGLYLGYYYVKAGM